MAEAIESILLKIGADIKELKKGLSKGKKDIQDFSKKSKKSLISMSSVVSTAVGFTLAGAVSRAADSVKQFAADGVKDAFAFERAMISLEIQTSNTADTLINDLRKASNSTVSSLELVQTANKALALGISQNQLPELMEVATARAKVMGITATQAFNDIAVGIGRQSRMILDNLGIILDLDKAQSSYAEKIGKTADQLTEMEKKAAITNQILEESRGITAALNAVQADSLSSIERMRASFADLKLEVGTGLANAFNAFSFAFSEMKTQVGDVVLIEDAQEAIKNYGQEILELQNSSRSASDSIKSLQASIREITLSDEAARSTEELEKQQAVDRQRLAIAKEEAAINTEIQKLVDEGVSRKEAETFVDTARLDGLNNELDILRNDLEVSRLQNSVDNQGLELLKKQELSRQKSAQFGVDDLSSAKEKIVALGEEFDTNLKIIDQGKERIDQVSDLVIKEQERTKEVTAQEASYRRQLAITTLLGQGVSFTQPLGEQIKDITSQISLGFGTPQQFVNTPSAVSSGGSTVIINISELSATDPNEVAELLNTELSSLIRTP